MKLLLTCLAALAPLLAQVPHTGEIEIYGLRRVSPEKIRKVLGIKVGDPLPPSKGDLEERLETISDVVVARVQAVCCADGGAVLFVGIQERGAPHFAVRSEPSGQAVLPDDIVETYRKFLAAVGTAARRGDTAEDLTNGYSLMADPDARALQQQFLSFAGEHVSLIREVLRTSSDPEHRAIAATLTGYEPERKAAVADLEYAMQDPDETVRANATLSLSAIGVLARLRPERGIMVSATWFVEMLNSVELGDRTKAARALVSLTEQNGAPALEQIRSRALDSVVEMARWRSLDYALPAFILTGRIAGLSEKQIQDAWTAGDREAVIRKALKKPPPGAFLVWRAPASVVLSCIGTITR